MTRQRCQPPNQQPRGPGVFSLTTRSAMTPLDSEVKEECLRKDLQFYFMSPCEKYRARRQIPWKLGLQILKILMVTAQLVRFGLSNQLVVAFKEENSVAFKHLFLKGYSGMDEDDFSYSVYTQEDLYENLFFAINQFQCLKNLSLGTLDYAENEEEGIGLNICKRQYRSGAVLPLNGTLDISSDAEVASAISEKDCVHLTLQTLSKNSGEWKSLPFFKLEFHRLLQVDVSLPLKGIDLQTLHAQELPDCYIFHNTITFDNKAHSGKMKVYFESDAKIQECKGLNVSGSVQKTTQYVLLFDACVIVVCLASLVLCTRSIVLALQLRKRFQTFVLEKHQRHLCDYDCWEFINGWYILIIISDLMTIIGSILKMEIKAKNLTNYDLCSILLGTSTLFVWIGVIRYLGYFQTYNVLILTMRASLPKVLRFCACASMIYLGYTFCGWIVLGPYHTKFENLNTVAECLFSLVNGDDMFSTFAQIQQKSTLVWLFSRLYLYSFISLFIYMVLSLFIALITDSYHTVKKYQQKGLPETDLQEFLRECGSGEKYESEPSAPVFCTCCLKRERNDDHLTLVH